MFDVTRSAHLGTLRSRLTVERLTSYDAATTCPTASLALYEWNSEVGAAFFVSLQGFEVVLRNALHLQLTLWHRREGLSGHWFDDPRRLLDPRGTADVEEARRRIGRLRRPFTPGRIVSELSFGFWRYLLSARYEQSLWTPALRHAFPHLRPQRRRDIAERVERLHLVRNRLAHHEPVHRRDLARDHADLLFVVDAICPVTRSWIDRTSTLGEVIGRRPG